MMIKSFWERLRDKRGEKQHGKLLFLLGIGGILLIFLSELPFGGTQVSESDQTDLDSYVQRLEERLAETVGAIEGVGRAKIMLTLEGNGETVYAEEEKTTHSETSAQSNANSSVQNSYENELVIVDGGSGRQALVETALEPEIRGVAIVCEGGDDIAVVKRITDLVSVVLGVPTSRKRKKKMT